MAAHQQGYHHHSLLGLPQHVLDAVFGALSAPEQAVCSLVCTAWRDLPYEYLPPTLQLQPGPQADGILGAGLSRCRDLHTLCVSSSKDPVWPRFAAALAQERLPSLRDLHIQHSSQTDAAHLEQLRTILQVQGPQCRLHLALTDKASLQALLPLLPLQGLASLELNVPYLADGALQLLLHAATVQAAALTTGSSGSGTGGVQTPPAQLQMPWSGHQQHQQHQQQQGEEAVLRVGLWVCCWGGCPGLLLSDALGLHSKLQQLPGCRMTGCESINISTAADLAALSQLKGLEALGVNFVSSDSSRGVPISLDVPAAPAAAPAAAAAAAGVGTSSGGTSSGSSGGGDITNLAVLATLSSSLKQLGIRGSPPGGWGMTPSNSSPSPPSPQQQHRQQQAPQRLAVPQPHALAALTGLTKLALQKDWSRPALPLAPLQALTLLQELAVERTGLQHPCELSCLGALTQVKVLSLVLTVTAEELAQAAQGGNWQAVGPAGRPAHWLQQAHQECAALLNKLSTLQVQDGAGAAGMEWGAQDADAAACTCCCSPAASGLGSGAAAACGWGPAEGGAATAELLRQVLACPVYSGTTCPALLDWSWLVKLQQLETAWLQVPHLDLTFLPSSLVELDAQQPRDLTRVSITCSNSRGINLPKLQRLVLPHLLTPAANRHQPGALSPGMLAAEGPAIPAAGSQGGYASDSDADSSDSRSSSDLLTHWEAALVLSLSQGCPGLRELELVQWQPPNTAVLAAAQSLRWLKLLSVVAPEGCGAELQDQVAAVRTQQQLRGVDLQLQEPLVLSSYPWSSVLAVR